MTRAVTAAPTGSIPAGGIPLVRAALAADLPAVALGVKALLEELGGTPPEIGSIIGAARALLDGSQPGALLLSATADEIVGLLAASLQSAMHAPRGYLLIQDLWVRPDWRGRRIGAALISALDETARAGGLTRIEVGLPGKGFAQLRATEAFYRSNGFELVGPRMRRALP